MGNKFLFIEIRDQEISSLLNKLRELFSNRKFHTGIHITIKGPQKSFRTKSIEKFLEEKNPIKIYDAGIFLNRDTYIVYLKVICNNLRGHLWRKPDYKDEINPHITLYKGSDKNIAEAVLEFLKKENISLECKDYGIITHTQRQRELFSKPPKSDEPDIYNLEQGECIKKGILSRAADVLVEAKRQGVA